LERTEFSQTEQTVPFFKVHTLVIGSGAAGLNAAVQLRKHGVKDVLILTEGLAKGTSINTGSDKQTYYKLSLYGAEDDSPHAVAETLYAGGSMHGDLALVEASYSARAFHHLVDLGVPFPRDRFGQFVGYKTDYDPRRRATSIGPHTSREMCRVLIREVKRWGIPVHENRVAVSLLTIGREGERRIAGAIALNLEKELDPDGDWGSVFELYAAENVVFATGGPGGLYKTSVYPVGHTGGIGLALLTGAAAQTLPESQFGLASTKFRWNLSGSYMQVIPRIFSTGPDGRSDEGDFLEPYFPTPADLNSAVFLKGYQWPFDVRKVSGGSSLIDVLVYLETVVKRRRVFLDYRRNPPGFDFDLLSDEARDYLLKSGAQAGTPIERLNRLNPAAARLYLDHGIDLERHPLEVAVCAQHNNGGLAASTWWESVNIRHLFPVGEVNGTHGVSRPGGSALNSGQVGGFRAAEYVAHRYAGWTLDTDQFTRSAERALSDIWTWIAAGENTALTWETEREIFQRRMTRAGSHIRSLSELNRGVREAWEQWGRLRAGRCHVERKEDLAEGLRNLQLCFAHAVYMEAIRFAVRSGVGSRGSSMVLDEKGTLPHRDLEDGWRFSPENPAFREKVLETVASADGEAENRWVDRRPLPQTEAWFETAWSAFQAGKIYESDS
jgi:succinate dehydrogenase/fumarate reductase flavoprotein subunit